MAQPYEHSRAQGGPREEAALRSDALDTDRTHVLSGFGDTLPRSALEDEGREAGFGALRQVGRYKVRERIGRGAMATVYKAHDPDIGRSLALKFLHPDLCVDEEYRGRFLREAKAAGALSHPNIVTVFDVGEIEHRPYIAMELLEGTPLSEIMRPGERLPVRDVAHIGGQLARALDYAHSKGIFHRDIKPSNIVRLKDGTIKVADFGIAHVEGGQNTQQTRVGTVLGTPQYMSPEQAMGLKVDGRSDLFSVGVVLYQLLTGQAPFEATSLVTLAHRIAKEEPTPIDQLRGDIPPALRRLVERCLKKNPDKRFATGGELATALDRVIGEIDEDSRGKQRERIVPLRVKWTISMAVVVAVTMGLIAAIVTQRQYAAVMGQATEYGASLAKFLATESAESALAQEWVNVDVSVKDIMESQRFHQIAVVDRQGVVRVSSDAQAVEKPYQAPSGERQIASRPDGVVVRSYDRADGETILDFDAPIRFKKGEQRIDIGRVHLGIPEKPLSRVARLSLGWLALLILITVAAVMLATYLLANRYSKALRLLSESMSELAKGRFDYRIAEQRNDEVGEVYRAFDSMAQALQKRAEPEDASPPP